MGDFAKDYAFGRRCHADAELRSAGDLSTASAAPTAASPTRNYIGILTSVNCSAHVAGMVADIFKKNPFTGDNPWPISPMSMRGGATHKTGCGMTQDEPLRILRRTLGGYARHVNFSAVVVLGLGLRVNQIGGLMKEQKLAGACASWRFRKSAAPARPWRRRRLRARGAYRRQHVHREPVSASELTVALQCGGSDGYSASPPIRRWALPATIGAATAAP